jgi:hypothetical protein
MTSSSFRLVDSFHSVLSPPSVRAGDEEEERCIHGHVVVKGHDLCLNTEDLAPSLRVLGHVGGVQMHELAAELEQLMAAAVHEHYA